MRRSASADSVTLTRRTAHNPSLEVPHEYSVKVSAGRHRAFPALGYGCLESGCSHDEWGFSGRGQLGGTLSPSIRLAGGTNGFYKEIDEVDFTVATLTFQVQWYPNEGDFFLLGGAGLAWAEASASFEGLTVSDSETGAGFVAGLGYDLSINKSGSLALTPFFNWVVTTIDPTLDFLQFGLALTFN
jgi:hypothetical protein